MARRKRDFTLADVQGPQGRPRVEGGGPLPSRTVSVAQKKFVPKREPVDFRQLSATLDAAFQAAEMFKVKLDAENQTGAGQDFMTPKGEEDSEDGGVNKWVKIDAANQTMHSELMEGEGEVTSISNYQPGVNNPAAKSGKDSKKQTAPGWHPPMELPKKTSAMKKTKKKAPTKAKKKKTKKKKEPGAGKNPFSLY